MQFRTTDAQGLGITFARVNPAKDEARIRAAIASELGPTVSGEITVLRRPVTPKPDQRSALMRFLDPKVAVSFVFEVGIPVAGRQPVDLMLAISERGLIGTTVKEVIAIDVDRKLIGPFSLQVGGQLSGSADLVALIEGKKPLLRKLRAPLRTSYQLGQLRVFGSASMTVEPVGEKARLT